MLLISMGLPAFASTNAWEPLKTEQSDAKSVLVVEDAEILTQPSKIIITINRRQKIEVFTILGRLVSAEILEPGSYVFPVGVHGIYIIKVGEQTCKIAI